MSRPNLEMFWCCAVPCCVHSVLCCTVLYCVQAHERSLDTDILFGLVRRLQPQRPDLRVVVMSATLDVHLFERFFRVSVPDNWRMTVDVKHGV